MQRRSVVLPVFQRLRCWAGCVLTGTKAIPAWGAVGCIVVLSLPGRSDAFHLSAITRMSLLFAVMGSMGILAEARIRSDLASLAGSAERVLRGLWRTACQATRDNAGQSTTSPVWREAATSLLQHEGVILIGKKDVIEAVFGQAGSLMGLRDGAVPIGQPYQSFIASLVADGLLSLPSTEQPEAFVASLLDAGGSWDVSLPDGRWTRLLMPPVGKGRRSVTLRDVTGEKKNEAALAQANVALDALVTHGAWRDDELRRVNVRLDTALANMPHGLAMYDQDGKLQMASGRFAAMFGISRQSIFPGMSLARLAALSIRAGNHVGADDATERASFVLSGSLAGNGTATALVGERTLSIVRRLMDDGGAVVTYEDVTERTRAEARVHYLAHHDILTGLANRSLLSQTLDGAFGRIDRRSPGMGVAVLCLDLDRFKSVNDAYGHAIGDLLLREVASRLQACVRETDMVARLGGDEFVVVLDQTRSQCADDAAEVSRRIIASMADPFMLDGVCVMTGTSVGIAIASDATMKPADLMERADFALYKAKMAGRGTYCFFEGGMDTEYRERALLETDLLLALDRGEFELLFQPVMHAASRRIKAFEALLRWNHPRLGVLMPSSFLPAAEKTGKVVPIGEWVLRRACAEAAGWPSDVGVTVSLAPSQFKDPGLAAKVRDALAASRLPAFRLELEITEAVLLNPTPFSVGILDDLEQLKVRISLDDFASKRTPLRHLLDFRPHCLKVDQEFFRKFPTRNEDSETVLSALLDVERKFRKRNAADKSRAGANPIAPAAHAPCEIRGFVRNPPVSSDAVSGLVQKSGVLATDIAGIIHILHG